MNATTVKEAEREVETLRVLVAVIEDALRDYIVTELAEHRDRFCVSVVCPCDEFEAKSLVAMLAETMACDAHFLIHTVQPGQSVPEIYENCFFKNPALLVISLDEVTRSVRYFAQEVAEVEASATEPAKFFTDLVSAAPKCASS